jgi:post-segregation antitoxin (ccd killing protein)
VERPLANDLRALRDLFRRYVSSHQRPTIDACRELTTKLSMMAEQADWLAARSTLADEMEEIARDLDLAASAALSPALQAGLKNEQRALQARLDAGGDLGPVHVPRPVEIAVLATPIGDSNVISFPLAPSNVRLVGDAGEYIALSDRNGGGDAA